MHLEASSAGGAVCGGGLSGDVGADAGGGDAAKAMQMHGIGHSAQENDNDGRNVLGRTRSQRRMRAVDGDVRRGQEMQEMEGVMDPGKTTQKPPRHLPHPVVACIALWTSRLHRVRVRESSSSSSSSSFSSDGDSPSKSRAEIVPRNPLLDPESIRQRSLASLARTNRAFASEALPLLYSRVAPTSLACFRRFLATCHAWWEADVAEAAASATASAGGGGATGTGTGSGEWSTDMHEDSSSAAPPARGGRSRSARASSSRRTLRSSPSSSSSSSSSSRSSLSPSSSSSSPPTTLTLPHTHLTSHIKELVLSRLVRSGLSDNEILAFTLFADTSRLQALILPLEYHYIFPWEIEDHAAYVADAAGIEAHQGQAQVRFGPGEDPDVEDFDPDSDVDVDGGAGAGAGAGAGQVTGTGAGAGAGTGEGDGSAVDVESGGESGEDETEEGTEGEVEVDTDGEDVEMHDGDDMQEPPSNPPPLLETATSLATFLTATSLSATGSVPISIPPLAHAVGSPIPAPTPALEPFSASPPAGGVGDGWTTQPLPSNIDGWTVVDPDEGDAVMDDVEPGLGSSRTAQTQLADVAAQATAAEPPTITVTAVDPSPPTPHLSDAAHLPTAPATAPLAPPPAAALEAPPAPAPPQRPSPFSEYPFLPIPAVPLPLPHPPPPPPRPSTVIASHPTTSSISPTRPHPNVLATFYALAERQAEAVARAAGVPPHHPAASVLRQSAAVPFVRGGCGVREMARRVARLRAAGSAPTSAAPPPPPVVVGAPSLPVPLGGRLTLPALALLLATSPSLERVRLPEFSDAPQHADGCVRVMVGRTGERIGASVKSREGSEAADKDVVENWLREGEVWGRGLRRLRSLDLSASNNLLLTETSNRLLEDLLRGCPLEELWTGHMWGADPRALLMALPAIRSPPARTIAADLADRHAAAIAEMARRRRGWPVMGARPLGMASDSSALVRRPGGRETTPPPTKVAAGVEETDAAAEEEGYFYVPTRDDERIPEGRLRWMLEDARWAEGREGVGSGVSGVEDAWGWTSVSEVVSGPAEAVAWRRLRTRLPLRSSAMTVPTGVTRVTPLPLRTLQLGGFTFHPESLSALFPPALAALHPALTDLELRLDQRGDDAEAACLSMPESLPNLRRFAVAAPPLSKQALMCLARHPSLTAIILYFSQENWDDECMQEVAARGRVDTLCMPRSRVTVRGVLGYLAALGTKVRMMDVEECMGVIEAGSRDDPEQGFAVGKVLVEVPEWGPRSEDGDQQNDISGTSFTARPPRVIEGPTGAFVMVTGFAELCGGPGSRLDTIDMGYMDFRPRRPAPSLRTMHAGNLVVPSTQAGTVWIDGEGGSSRQIGAGVPTRDPRVPAHLPHEPGGPLWSASDPVWGNRSGETALRKMMERCSGLHTLGYQKVNGLRREFCKDVLEERFGPPEGLWLIKWRLLQKSRLKWAE
ncbi:hypothetical protein M427DRAFT_65201 [Gonapodya prolifera JEL478]|uniref:Uncharacterized protein n=1 Tax=Gonapodya prolifera (strain JEL478) TaxID=1344416 RepID=A0A139AZJ2_GONPJ|nr:hypothetical protein M427DRAFT_65201 [Gonapodya prolifera JEL478]|eukprot:KXS22127.1 hypothetical protein M427DRAFT_65201 [Gonapodya prolifera JEL478]